jgi:hypothetical protein
MTSLIGQSVPYQYQGEAKVPLVVQEPSLPFSTVVQNYTNSGLPELSNILNSFSLTFNQVKMPEFGRDDFFVFCKEALLRLGKTTPYYSPEQFLQYVSKIKINPDNYRFLIDFDNNPSVQSALIALFYTLPLIVSPALGCVHDFGDKKTAELTFNSNIAYYSAIYPTIFGTANLYAQYIFSLSKTATQTTDTAKMDRIWEHIQTDIDEKMHSLLPNANYPIANATIARMRDDEDKSTRKKYDIDNIIKYLTEIGVPKEIIAWAVDTFQSLLLDVSPHKLNTSESITKIDGASSSTEGTVTIPGASNKKNLYIGQDLFLYKNGKILVYRLKPEFIIPAENGGGHPDYPDIYQNDLVLTENSEEIRFLDHYYIKVATGALGASVTTIINTILTLGYDLSNKARSAIESEYEIQWSDIVVLTTAQKVEILEKIKAIGDKGPIDILRKCFNIESFYRKYLGLLSTGDLLALSECPSGIFISAYQIKIKIPMVMINMDVFQPLMDQFKYLVGQSIALTTMFLREGVVQQIMSNIAKLFMFSPGGQIMAYAFMSQFNNYIQNTNNNLFKIITAIEHLKKLLESSTDENFNTFYEYISYELTSIDFSPVPLYNLLFGPNPNNPDNLIYTWDEETKKLVIFPQKFDPITGIPIVQFCDEAAYSRDIQLAILPITNNTVFIDLFELMNMIFNNPANNPIVVFINGTQYNIKIPNSPDVYALIETLHHGINTGPEHSASYVQVAKQILTATFPIMFSNGTAGTLTGSEIILGYINNEINGYTLQKKKLTKEQDSAYKKYEQIKPYIQQLLNEQFGCIGDTSTYTRANIPDYLKIECSKYDKNSEGVNELVDSIKHDETDYARKLATLPFADSASCIDSYSRNLPFVPIFPKITEGISRNFTDNDGEVQIGSLYTGSIVLENYKRKVTSLQETDRTKIEYESDPTNPELPIKEYKRIAGAVPLIVLRNSVDGNLLEIYWSIPYYEFLIGTDTIPTNIMTYASESIFRHKDILLYKFKYIIKTTQFALEQLYGSSSYNYSPEEMVYMIEYMFLSLYFCHFSETIVDNDTEAVINHGKRTKNIIPVSSDQGKKIQSLFVLMIYIMFCTTGENGYTVDYISTFINTIVGFSEDQMSVFLSASHNFDPQLTRENYTVISEPVLKLMKERYIKMFDKMNTLMIGSQTIKDANGSFFPNNFDKTSEYARVAEIAQKFFVEQLCGGKIATLEPVSFGGKKNQCRKHKSKSKKIKKTRKIKKQKKIRKTYNKKTNNKNKTYKNTSSKNKTYKKRKNKNKKNKTL